jgi:L-asparaginase
LQGIGKPVVFTGAQVPPDIIGSDAMGNLVHAFQVASMDLAEVVIVFGDVILRGNRSMKASESQRNAFMSPVFPQLGSIRLQPEIIYPSVRRRHSGRPTLQAEFAGNIAMLKCVPGLTTGVLDSIIGGGIDGLILETFGPGNVPNQEHSLLPSIAKAKKKNIPIVICTQCIFGTTRMYLYEVGRQAMELGVIPSRDMTPEAAFVKLKWALGQTKNAQEIAAIFDRDIAGEVTL